MHLTDKTAVVDGSDHLCAAANDVCGPVIRREVELMRCFGCIHGGTIACSSGARQRDRARQLLIVV